MQGGTMYGATKHGVLGAMRALHPDCRQLGIRIGIVHPWFSPTGIITPEYKT
jgi:NAD(P)-dependent dehydrogenase (short-subunit alcohol dehydrogenase family)